MFHLHGIQHNLNRERLQLENNHHFHTLLYLTNMPPLHLFGTQDAHRHLSPYIIYIHHFVGEKEDLQHLFHWVERSRELFPILNELEVYIQKHMDHLTKSLQEEFFLAIQDEFRVNCTRQMFRISHLQKTIRSGQENQYSVKEHYIMPIAGHQ